MNPDQKITNTIPDYWYNIQHDLPEPLPTVKDVIDEGGSRIERMNKIRLQTLNEQDANTEKWVKIPDEVRQKYSEIGRPTPLLRATKFEKYLGTNARIYIKREDLLPTHSFKLNSAIAQAYYAKEEGAKGLVTETGAGQWGLAMSWAANAFELECKVFWVKISRKQKPYRVDWCKLLGTEIIDSPSEHTWLGKEILSKDPDSYGSLGISIGEAISFVSENPQYKYVSGSNLPHVLLHQSVIGLETIEQLKLYNEEPNILIACCGGGSNLGGFAGPFLEEKLKNDQLRLIAAESTAAPRLTTGEYKYDYADPGRLSPLTLSYTLGNDYMPPPVHVGGLRQHNGSTVIGLLRHLNLLEAYAYDQKQAFDAGKLFAKLYGIIPAPETCHAIKATIDLALEAKKNKKKPVIVMCYSGNGILDFEGYKSVNK